MLADARSLAPGGQLQRQCSALHHYAQNALLQLWARMQQELHG